MTFKACNSIKTVAVTIKQAPARTSSSPLSNDVQKVVPRNTFFREIEAWSRLGQAGKYPDKALQLFFGKEAGVPPAIRDSLTGICRRATTAITAGCLTVKQVITKEQTT